MQKASLYRHFDAEGRLLYVGISKNAVCRLEGHQEKSWYEELETVRIERYPSREHALYAEAVAIRDENPRYNIKRPLPVHPDEAKLLRKLRLFPIDAPSLAKPCLPSMPEANHVPLRTLIYTVFPGAKDGCISARQEDTLAVVDVGESDRGVIKIMKATNRHGLKLVTDRPKRFRKWSAVLQERDITLVVSDAKELLAEVKRLHNRTYQRRWRAKKQKNQS